MEINAIHVNWTKPFFAKNKDRMYSIDDFEILSTILSALLWRDLNGPIKLYTDGAGYEFYRMLGILDIWDGGIDVHTLESIPTSIDPEIYWAAAKIFAIRNEKAPVVMMDSSHALISVTSMQRAMLARHLCCHSVTHAVSIASVFCHSMCPISSLLQQISTGMKPVKS